MILDVLDFLNQKSLIGVLKSFSSLVLACSG